MPRIIRTILFIFFVILFFVSAASLVLYASGYRYHFLKKSFEKTGQLIVETVPKSAVLIVNGAPVKKDFSDESMTTPMTVPYLLSGDYDISIEKEGFYPVARHITIAPGKTVILNTVVLIKKSNPTREIARRGIRGATTIDEGIMYHDGRTVYIFDEHQDKERIVYSSPRDIGTIYPSQSGRMVVVTDTQKKWSVIDRGMVRVTDKDMETAVRQFRWSGDELYALTDGAISRIDTDKKMNIPLVSVMRPKDFFIDGDIFILHEKPTHSISRFDKKTGALVREITSIPIVDSIVKEYGRFLVVKGVAGSSFYLYDTTSQRPIFQEVRDARDIVFSSPENFFSFNDFELWRHQWHDDQYLRTLITRQSEVITAIVPFTTRNIIVLATDNGAIRIRDLDTDRSPEADGAMMDRLDFVFLNTQQTALWIVGSKGGEDGLFSLPLIEEESLFPLVK